jgi:hypothetical protein
MSNTNATPSIDANQKATISMRAIREVQNGTD